MVAELILILGLLFGGDLPPEKDGEQGIELLGNGGGGCPAGICKDG